MVAYFVQGCERFHTEYISQCTLLKLHIPYGAQLFVKRLLIFAVFLFIFFHLVYLTMHAFF